VGRGFRRSRGLHGRQSHLSPSPAGRALGFQVTFRLITRLKPT
jgi:hypothetical protein